MCTECGTLLREGACPACSLRLLLGEPCGEEEEGSARGWPGRPADGERYQLQRKIASGGMGVVWAAQDMRLRRTVALKMVRGARFADENEMARFEIEAAAAAALDHPHIVPVYEVGRMDGQPFFTMKLIEGVSLAERLRERGRLPAQEAVALLTKMARAVQHAHSRGVLHRDLKPGNILIDESGEPWLTDFGLAKVTSTESGLTVSSHHLGTPHYMAPETAAGRGHDISTASDVWALGVILWEVVCGSRPFHGQSSLETLRQIIEEEPTPPPNCRLDEDLLTLARRCMEKSPMRRPHSAGEVAEELDRWLRGEPLRARKISTGEALWKWVRRKPVLAGLYAALGIGLGSGLVLWRRAETAVGALTVANQRINSALHVSTASRLATEARLQMNGAAPLALLLAAEAVDLARKSGEPDALASAESALMDAIRAAGGRDASAVAVPPVAAEGWLQRNRLHVRSLQPSPDGRWLVTLSAAAAGRVHAALFDVADQDQKAPVRRWDLMADGDCALTWTADSRKLLVVGGDGEVRLWDLVPKETAAMTKTPGPSSPASRRLGSVGADGVAPASMAFFHLHGNPVGLMLAQPPPPGTGQAPGEIVYHSLDLPAAVALGPARRLAAKNGKYRLLASADGQWIASLGAREAPLLLFHQSGRDPIEVPLGDYNENLARLDTTATRLAVVRPKGLVEFFDLSSGQAADIARSGRLSPPCPSRVVDLALSPDGRWAAVCSEDAAVAIIPADAPSSRTWVRTNARSTHAAVFSRDSQWLAVGGNDRVIYAWPVTGLDGTAAPLELRGLPQVPVVLEFANDRRSLSALGVGSVARFWPFDGNTAGTMPLASAPTSGEHQGFAVSPDGRWILTATSAGKYGQVGLMDVHAHDVHRHLAPRPLASHQGQATSVAICPLGRWAASAGRDNTVHVWDWPSLRAALESDAVTLPPPRYSLPMTGIRTDFRRHLAFHPRGVLYASSGDGLLFEWTLTAPDPAATEARHAIHSIGYLLPALSVSPDGRWLAVARHGWDAEPAPGSTQRGNMVLVFDVSSPGPPLPRFELPAHFVTMARVVFSPDSRWLAAGAYGHPPTLWDLSARHPAATPRTAPVASQVLLGLDFSPDGQWLALAGDDRRLHFWEWQSPAGRVRSTDTLAPLHHAAWLPNGRLATGGLDGKVRIWETNVDRLLLLARRTAGRALSESERLQFRISGEKIVSPTQEGETRENYIFHNFSNSW